MIVDSRGTMQGLIHLNRRSEYAKNVIVFVSNSTPQAYLDYLKKRNYDIIQAGEDRVDLRAALEELNRQYGVKTVVTDTSGVLASVLLEQELVDEVQLLVLTEIVGKNAVQLFLNLNKRVKMELAKSVVLDKNHILLSFNVLNE